EGSELRLTLQRGTGDPFEVAVKRSLSAARAFQEHLLAEKRPQNYAEIKPGIFYMDISAIKAAELAAAMRKWERQRVSSVICEVILPEMRLPCCPILPISP